MKNYNRKSIINSFICVLLLGLTLGSCESYLDKSPQASITDKDAFGNFTSFQGYVEELYSCVTDPNKAGAPNVYLYADEILRNTPLPFDQGNYWSQGDYLWGPTADTGPETRTKKVWPLCWYGIRKANVALSKLNFLVDATQEQKDIIKGQTLFFRGWLYFELMRNWGGLPYIDTVLVSTGELDRPRLNYRETALKAAEDFRQAAALLPARWDDTDTGKPTLGNNQQRISKVCALAYLGKDLLFAASPMMNEESTGNKTFDVELCKQAAAAFADAINICSTTGAYKLQPWATWTDIFWVASNTAINGGTEVIMNPTVYLRGRAVASTVLEYIPIPLGGSNTETPTHNYVKNYGMANGLPIDDPNSGYNPNDPWINREPRFYKDIVVDRDQIVKSTAAGIDQFAQLYNGGRHKGGTLGSVTGYYHKKWAGYGINKWDNLTTYQSYVPFMRLPDVYLMYAESVLQGYGTAQSSVPGSITAEAAVNVIRNRAQLPNLTSAYTATKDKFMEVIIRERAVELAFEGQRWFDLRRWNLAGETKYTEKTAIDFDRAANGKPINLKERVLVTRVFDKKHNWLPFQVNYTLLYKDFPQNPGW